MPGSDGTPARRREPDSPKFRRPPDELLRRTVRRLVRGSRASFASQAAFRSALLDALRRDEPLATVGGRRLRRLLVGVPGVRLSVRYAERPGRPTPLACPVCAGELFPIRNRTLSGDVVVLGRRCRTCAYWTHGALRVPVRYTVSQATARPRERAA